MPCAQQETIAARWVEMRSHASSIEPRSEAYLCLDGLSLCFLPLLGNDKLHALRVLLGRHLLLDRALEQIGQDDSLEQHRFDSDAPRREHLLQLGQQLRLHLGATAGVQRRSFCLRSQTAHGRRELGLDDRRGVFFAQREEDVAHLVRSHVEEARDVELENEDRHRSYKLSKIAAAEEAAEREAKDV